MSQCDCSLTNHWLLASLSLIHSSRVLHCHLKPDVLERKVLVYNNNNITFFSVLTFVCQALCDIVLQPSALRGSGCITLLWSLANVNTWKRMFYPLIQINIINQCKWKSSLIRVYTGCLSDPLFYTSTGNQWTEVTF